MIGLYLKLGLFLLIYASFWFLISLIKKRNDVADVAWGLGYVGICLYCYLVYPTHPILLLLFGLVSIWGFRLSIYIGFRNAQKSEDFRYKKWREEWGNTFYWRSFLQVFMLQAFLLLLISSPVIMAVSSEPMEWHWTTSVGMLLWLVGFYWQSVGDYQLSQFRKQRSNKNEVMSRGLWKYSRHPNYFGEILMWWSIYILVFPLEYGVYAIVSPMLVTWLLISVSGIPMLERKYKGNPEYERYKKETPALLPKFW